MSDREKLVIVGGGPAGLTAAIYAARADLAPLVVTGQQPGGQLMLTSEVENYPGFPEGIAGPELMGNMRRQAERFGARFLDEEMTEVDFRGPPLRLVADSGELRAQSVIIATGASARWLGVPGERRLVGRGSRPARPATASSSGTGESWSSAGETPRSRRLSS